VDLERVIFAWPPEKLIATVWPDISWGEHVA
jgi:hypothetical protein